MSIPLIIVAAGGAGLLFAGSKEKKPAAPSTSSTVTPTTQSTGGDNGGPQAPSHAGSEALNTSSDVAGAATDVRTQSASTTGPSGTGAPSPDDLDINAGAGPIADPVDPWATPAGPSVTKPMTGASALSAVGQIGVQTGKAAAQGFLVAANALGAIW